MYRFHNDMKYNRIFAHRSKKKTVKLFGITHKIILIQISGKFLKGWTVSRKEGKAVQERRWNLHISARERVKSNFYNRIYK